MAILSVVMSLNGFFASFYLNKLADSKERATLLSFKGLCCNMGFGLISLYYSGVSAAWPSEEPSDYLRSLYSLGAYFALLAVVYLIYRRYRLKSAKAV